MVIDAAKGIEARTENYSRSAASRDNPYCHLPSTRWTARRGTRLISSNEIEKTLALDSAPLDLDDRVAAGR